MKRIRLNNGVEMPPIGLGTFRLQGRDAYETVRLALETGYRLIDTAQFYQNEVEIGRAVHDSGVAREDIFLITKVWLTSAGEEKSYCAVMDSLKRLGTDYADLLLVHQPHGDYYGTYRTLEKMLASGRTRAIGVSNFTAERFLDLRAFNNISPAVNQLEVHIFNQQRENVSISKEFGAQIMAWAPLGRGINWLLQDERLVYIAFAHDKTPAQIALRYLIQKGIVPIPKASSATHLTENISVFDFILNPEEMLLLDSLDKSETTGVAPGSLESVARLCGL